MIYLELFWAFFKTSLFSFGGGYAMIPMVKQEVLNHAWLTESAILDFIGISESTPGPFIINLATFVGNNVGGIPGALVSTFAVALPSFIIMLIIAKFLPKIIDNKFVKGALDGMMGIIIGLILGCGITIAYKVLVPTVDGEAVFAYIPIIIAGIIIAVKLFIEQVFKKRFSPVFVILLSAALGMIFF